MTAAGLSAVYCRYREDIAGEQTVMLDIQRTGERTGELTVLGRKFGFTVAKEALEITPTKFIFIPKDLQIFIMLWDKLAEICGI